MTLQWVREERPVAGLGALSEDQSRNFHARTVLADWNLAQPNSPVFLGYPTLGDLTMGTVWSWRDAQMLGSFTIWWNNPANPPLYDWGEQKLPEPNFNSPGMPGIQQSDLTLAHLQALDHWMKKRQLVMTCLEECLKNATGSAVAATSGNVTPDQLSLCLQACFGAAPPPPVILPTTCTGGRVMNAAGQCECPPGQVFDQAAGLCQPLPTPPPPTTTPPPPTTTPPPPTTTSPITTTSTKAKTTNAGTVLAVLAGLGLVGLIVNAAIKVPRAALGENPGRRTDRYGRFMIIERADGKCQVQNLDTGMRTRPYTRARCERILREIARLDAR